jgi:hypothetical protein
MRRPASFFPTFLLFERRPRPFRGNAKRRRGTATEQISAGHETSIYHHRGASYPLRVVTGEIERHPSYVLAGAGTRNRLNRPEQLLDDRFATRDMLVDERRVDAARTNAVDADAVAAEIDRGALGQVNDCGLGNAVRQRTAPPRNPAIDAVEIIEPPPALRISGIECLMPRKTPRSKIANVRSQFSTVVSSMLPNAPASPALLNMTSSLPNSLTARSSRP